MKRIMSACLMQTMKFETAEEFDAYKDALDKKSVRWVLLDRADAKDGSVTVSLKRQYNQYGTGSYI